MSRTRTSSFAWPGGGTRFHSFNGTDFLRQTQSPISGFRVDRCVDDLGKGIDHLLSITHTDLSGIAPLTGNTTSGLHSYGYSGWMPDANAAAPNAISWTLAPTGTEVATTTLARSNPSRPAFSLPNFLFELKDLPGMLEDIGRLKLLRNLNHKQFDFEVANRGFSAKSLANVNLSYLMGWSPLISDLRKLFQLEDRVMNRYHDLDVLFNKNGGLHRTVGKAIPPSVRNGMKGTAALWSHVDSTSDTLTIDSALGQLVQVRRDIITETNIWGSVRWTNPWPHGPRLSSRQLYRQARDIVFGISVSPKQIWDAVPWTWLVDWFANFGEFLDSTNNLLSLAPSVPLVMTHQATKECWSRSDTQSWVSGGGGTRLYETKTRLTAGAGLTATIPILGLRELSVLGSLAIQRSR